jgi:hypothetical protein
MAQQCDCQRAIGQCVGLVELVRSFGSAPSFGAELTIHSSEKKCSKVEYVVDGTPYRPLLVNRQKEPESIFGTSPIAASSITFSKCQVCFSQDSKAEDKNFAPTVAVATEADMAGEWRGTLSGANAGPLVVAFKVSDRALTGEMRLGGRTFTIESGSVSGNTVSWVQSFLFGDVRWTGTLDRTAGTIRGRWVHPVNSNAFEVTKDR